MPKFVAYRDGKLVAVGENLVEVTARAEVKKFREKYPEIVKTWDDAAKETEEVTSNGRG